MNSDKKIAWEKFNPPSEIDNFIAIQEENEEEKEQEWEESSDLDEADGQNIINTINGMEAFLMSRKIKTPFGYYEIDDPFSPYNMFECWIGHTNFRLTSEDFSILDNKINGIGCLKVLSPYRFFIGIEKMFTFPAVRIQIQKDLCGNLNFENDILDLNNTVDDQISLAISKINDALFNIKDSEKWALYISQDGNIQTIKNSDFDSEFEYHDKLKMLKSMKNGNIITYDSL